MHVGIYQFNTKIGLSAGTLIMAAENSASGQNFLVFYLEIKLQPYHNGLFAGT